MVVPSLPQPLQELTGQTPPWRDVVLPHDAMITEERGPDRGDRRDRVAPPRGTYEYRKTPRYLEQPRGKCVMLEFDGVYRDGTVFVNGQFAAHRPYGYSQFGVDLVLYLQVGEDNEIRVVAPPPSLPPPPPPPPPPGLRINGETVNLRGACIHHDNGVLGAATIARAEERRVELLKAAGLQRASAAPTTR